jgi:hypothetical protein
MEDLTKFIQISNGCNLKQKIELLSSAIRVNNMQMVHYLLDSINTI